MTLTRHTPVRKQSKNRAASRAVPWLMCRTCHRKGAARPAWSECDHRLGGPGICGQCGKRRSLVECHAYDFAKRLAKAKAKAKGFTSGSSAGRSQRRKKQPNPRNAKRRAAEFARCYHSKERVAFVKSLGCVYCTALSPLFGITTAGTSDNAHTANGGAGRKAGYGTIVPLCRSHHRMYDEHRWPLADPDVRACIAACAADVERLWQAHDGSGASVMRGEEECR